MVLIARLQYIYPNNKHVFVNNPKSKKNQTKIDHKSVKNRTTIEEETKKTGMHSASDSVTAQVAD